MHKIVYESLKFSLIEDSKCVYMFCLKHFFCVKRFQHMLGWVMPNLLVTLLFNCLLLNSALPSHLMVSSSLECEI
jgi:hypothetical protein